MHGHALARPQINGRFEVCKLAELDYALSYVAAIAVFACDAAEDIQALYAAYQAALSRLTDAGGGSRLLACRLFGVGAEAAVMECRAAVRVHKKMEGLVAMEPWEVAGSMLSFCMLDFASCLLMNIADAISQLRYGEMSLETPVDAAFGCALRLPVSVPVVCLHSFAHACVCATPAVAELSGRAQRAVGDRCTHGMCGAAHTSAHACVLVLHQETDGSARLAIRALAIFQAHCHPLGFALVAAGLPGRTHHKRHMRVKKKIFAAPARTAAAATARSRRGAR